MKITIHCDGIGCGRKVTIDAPMDGWTSRLGEIEEGGSDSYVFCPACQKQAEFFGAACPGCVEGFPDCNFGRMFAYGRSPGLTRGQEEILRSGRCPGRTNGTSIICSGALTSVDLSTPATASVGETMIAAVKEYRRKYMELKP